MALEVDFSSSLLMLTRLFWDWTQRKEEHVEESLGKQLLWWEDEHYLSTDEISHYFADFFCIKTMKQHAHKHISKFMPLLFTFFHVSTTLAA